MLAMTTATMMILLLGLLPLPVASLVLVIPPGILPAALGIVFALTTPPVTTQLPPPETPLFPQNDNNVVSVLEVVKVYGKLAGSECYGKQAPKGSSCQIKPSDLQQALSSSPPASTTSDETSTSNTVVVVSRDEFAARMEQMDFRWPLKPFGIEGSPSLAKTAVMNKGAETRVLMEELEARGLYDPRNPVGPLPTSLRPALNQKLQAEGILDPRAIDRAYEALLRSGRAGSSPTTEILGSGEGKGDGETITGFIDYYEFLKMFGPNSISWPK
jgi:hypothetical protein